MSITLQSIFNPKKAVLRKELQGLKLPQEAHKIHQLVFKSSFVLIVENSFLQ